MLKLEQCLWGPNKVIHKHIRGGRGGQLVVWSHLYVTLLVDVCASSTWAFFVAHLQVVMDHLPQWDVLIVRTNSGVEQLKHSQTHARMEHAAYTIITKYSYANATVYC
jgi:hypothetical protein